MAIPAVVPVTFEEVFCDWVLKTPLLPDDELVVGTEPVPVPVTSLPSEDPGVRGMAGFK